MGWTFFGWAVLATAAFLATRTLFAVNAPPAPDPGAYGSVSQMIMETYPLGTDAEVFAQALVDMGFELVAIDPDTGLLTAVLTRTFLTCEDRYIVDWVVRPDGVVINLRASEQISC
ncbi:MAG: hypothetical protein ACPGID_07185 [Rubricella sp.]